MLRQLKLAIALGAILIAFAATASPSNAGWGHHHHHGLGGWGHGHHHFHGGHFHGGRYGGSFYGRGFYGSSLGSGLGWGYPSYGAGYPSYGWGSGYSSLSISIGLPRYRSYYSSYGYAPSYSSYGYTPSYSSYGLTNYYAPPIYVYRPSLPAYYAPSTYYAAPSYYAPLNCPTCDPCISNPVVDCPTCDPNSAVPPGSVYSPPSTSAPAFPTPTYSTGTERNRVPSSILTRSAPSAQSMTAGGSMVDRMLGRVQSSSASVGSLANRARVTTPPRQPASLGSIRTVSTASKPVSQVSPLSQDSLALDHSRDFKPLPMGMLKSADEIFSAGRFRDAAAAYAHLTVHYGNHDELAARRFVAMVASGDCDQAAVLLELASASERPLLVSALPVGGLAELYAAQAEERHRHINYLADYALKHPHDSVALAMVGAWLEMDGQPERAQPFLESARRRANDTPSPASNPAIASRLVVTDAAR